MLPLLLSQVDKAYEQFIENQHFPASNLRFTVRHYSHICVFVLNRWNVSAHIRIAGRVDQLTLLNHDSRVEAYM